MTNRILCHEHETLLKLNFFQLIERHRSSDSVLISIYRLDAHDLKNGNADAIKKHFVFEYEFSLRASRPNPKRAGQQLWWPWYNLNPGYNCPLLWSWLYTWTTKQLFCMHILHACAISSWVQTKYIQYPVRGGSQPCPQLLSDSKPQILAIS